MPKISALVDAGPITATDLVAVVQSGSTVKMLATDVGGYPRTSAEIAAGVTPTDYSYEPGDVRRYGAAPRGSDSTAAFTAAIEVASAAGGGVVTCGEGAQYDIAGKLVLGTRVVLDLGWSSIWQTADNVPIIEVSRGAANYQWGIRNAVLRYATPQTAAQTDATGIRLAVAGVNSYLGTVENVRIQGACNAVDLPEAVGCGAFLVTLRNVWAYGCANYGFDLLGAVAGARTNIVLDACYVQQESGAEIATSRGFRIKRTQELTMRNCAADHIQNGPVLSLETCIGARVESFAAESCDMSASVNQTGIFRFSASDVTCGTLSLIGNTVSIGGTADGYALMTTEDSVVSIDTLYDSNTTVVDASSGQYYAVFSSGTSDRIVIGSHRISGTTPAAAFTDFGTVKKIRHYNGNDRTVVFNNSTHVPASAAPTSGTWALGDVAWNSAVAAGEPLGWICTSAGTPGTWVAFGQVGYRSGAASPVGAVTPNYVGEEYLNTAGPTWYKATGPAGTDWAALN